MRILVLGEGPNDLGHIAADGSLPPPGAIPVFVERLIKEVAPALAIEITAMCWRDLRAHRGTGFDRKLELAYGLYGRKISGIVGVVDRDGAKNRSRAPQLNAGAQFLDCQPDPESLVSRDEASDRNPKGRLRRLILDSPAGAGSRDFSMHYANIARQADLSTVERRCPSGFHGFAASVRGFAHRLIASAE